MADQLALVVTETGEQIGFLRLDGNTVTCEGQAGMIFRSRKRLARKKMSDRELFAWFATNGWSNGPLAIVKASSKGPSAGLPGGPGKQPE
jgi:hypothetical protein